MKSDTNSESNLEKLNPRNPVDAQRSQTREQVTSWGDRIHGAFDATGKFFVKGSEIAATTLGHFAAVLGHGAGGTMKAGRKGWRAYKSHNDVPQK